MRKTKRAAAILLVMIMVISIFAGCGTAEQTDESGTENSGSESSNATDRTYYYVGINNNHPYFYDIHQGFEFACEQFGCKVVKLGPDGWDPEAQAQALEQAITMNPDGIVVPVYDVAVLPGIKKANEADIPVVAIETTMDDAETLTYCGLDNVQAGRDTAAKLIEYAGTSGKVVALGFWGTSNMDQKLKGFEEYLAENSDWEVIAKLDDGAETEKALEAAKTAFNNYSEMTAICGFDSSSGAGIGAAMEEINIKPGKVTAICHDREVATLEYIQQGYLQCTLANKTSAMPYWAVSVLEDYHARDCMNIPISADNSACEVNSIPQNMFTGVVYINQENVEMFMTENMEEIDSPNYE